MKTDEIKSITDDIIKILNVAIKSQKLRNKILEIIPLINNDSRRALELLCDINVSIFPDYGDEIASALVFYLKAIVYCDLDRYEDALLCLSNVQGISTFGVVFGRKTLLGIQEEAKKLEYFIKEENGN